MSERITRATLETRLVFLNSKLRKLGTFKRLETEHRNGKTSLYLYCVDTSYGINQHSQCDRNLGKGTSRECIAIADRYVVNSI